jgi:transcriptional regulator with XRE-family HTH domain
VIRAARGLLNLSQRELAAKAGLSVNSLNNIEREVGSPRVDSIHAIRDALKHEGIEFLEHDGVRLTGELLEIEKVEGPDMLTNLFYDDVLRTFPGGNGELLIIGKDNKRFRSMDPERLAAYKKFEAAAIKNNIMERAVFLEDDTHFLSARNIYRWVPKELFGKVPMGIYGDNVAIVLWGPPLRMIIIRNKGIAESFRQQFEVIWSLGKPVPQDVYQFHYALKAKKALEEMNMADSVPLPAGKASDKKKTPAKGPAKKLAKSKAARR